MNLLKQLFLDGIAHLRELRWGGNTIRNERNRPRKVKHRGYYVNGERVFYRPAARFIPNIKGTRISFGLRISRHQART
jgi:hypothetical protein